MHAFVRFGETYSPRIPLGEADAIINLEISEIVRVIHYLKPEGEVWTNSGRIHGYFSKLRPDCYPDQERIEAMIGLKTHHLHIIPADRLAQESGSLRTVNMVMMGAFFGGNSFLEAKSVAWAIGQTNRKFATANLDAFWRGYRFSQKGGLRHLGAQEGAFGNSPVIEE